MTITELITALEKATGPSRELDCFIALAAGRARGVALRDMQTGPTDSQKSWMASSVVQKGAWFHPERYTASIDAALTLVPEGWEWELAWNNNMAYATFGIAPIEGESPSLAIALCIAALKARED